MLTLHVVSSHTKFLGDRAHALAMIQQLKLLYSDAQILDHNLDNDSEIQKLLKETLPAAKQPQYLLSVGTLGIDPLLAITALKKTLSADVAQLLTTHWCSHQFLPGALKDLLGEINLIGLPESEMPCLIDYAQSIKETDPALSKSIELFIQGEKSLATNAVGVAHDGTPENLAIKYLQFKDKILSHATGYEIVFLAGNAPDRMGKEYVFSPECSYAWGKIVAQKALQSGRALLITSGPRTSEAAIQAFMRPVNEVKAQEPSRFHYQLLPFNAYAGIEACKGASFAVLEAARLKAQAGCNSRIWTSIDSATMQTAAIQNAIPGTVVLVDVDSASEGHRSMAEYFHKGQYAHRLRWVSHNSIKPSSSSSSSSVASSALPFSGSFQEAYLEKAQVLPDPALVQAQQVSGYLQRSYQLSSSLDTAAAASRTAPSNL